MKVIRARARARTTQAGTGLFRYELRGLRPPTRIPEVVASPPSKRSRCDRVYPSSSTLRASPSLSFAPPVVSAAPKARAKREGNKGKNVRQRGAGGGGGGGGGAGGRGRGERYDTKM